MAEILNQDLTQNATVNAECLQVRRDVSISVPSPDADREMSIRWSDLNKLKRGLTDAADIPTDYSVLYGIFFGFSGSAVLASISFTFSKDLPTWVMPISIALAVGPFLLGCLTVYFSKVLRKIHRKTISNILADVEEIERRFQSAQQVENHRTQGINFLNPLILPASPPEPRP